jgi:methionyl aminopeptidase
LNIVLGRDRIQYKTDEQIRLMRRAGLVVADALDAVQAMMRPGLTTRELDEAASEVIRSAGATPSFLNYGHPPYPATTCISVNDEVVHGIPGGRVLVPGDVVSVDCGAILAGWHGDAAFTAIVSELGQDAAEVGTTADRELVERTRQALWHGIGAMAVGRRLNAIGSAVEDHAGARFGLVEEYGGHGIGTAMHQDPHVLNYRTRDAGRKMRPGMCLAIEPMLTAGDPATKVLPDHWTVITVDRSHAAHWEHTVALHGGGLWVLTARDGGEAGLAEVNARFAPLGD